MMIQIEKNAAKSKVVIRILFLKKSEQWIQT